MNGMRTSGSQNSSTLILQLYFYGQIENTHKNWWMEMYLTSPNKVKICNMLKHDKNNI